MINTSSFPDTAGPSSVEEQLKGYITSSLRKSGDLPLQYLTVEARDGHVYRSARVPVMFLSRCRNEDNRQAVRKTIESPE